MSKYTIRHTNLDTDPKYVEEGLINDTDLDIALLGRIRLEYGERLNQNLLNILENFSAPALAGSNPPTPDLAFVTDGVLQSPTEGQFWHNSSDFRIYVRIDNQWVALMNRDDYAGNWGQIAHGQYLPKPVSENGYEFPYSECIWNTSPAVMGKFDAFTCFADSSGLVTAQYRDETSGQTIDSIANYVIIGIKGNTNLGTIAPPPSPPAPSESVPATPTPTPTIGVSATPTPTTTRTPTPTPTQGSSPTPTGTVTPTPAPTSTRTPTPTPTPTTIPPMAVSITDPEGGTAAAALVSYCNIASYNSTTRDSGYGTCAASTVSTCADGACAPEPGDNTLGPVMRVTVTGGVAPYTVKLKNFQSNATSDIQNPSFETVGSGWAAESGWTIGGTGQTAFAGTRYAVYNSIGTASITNNTKASVVPGQFVRATCQVNQGASSAGTGGAAIGITWYNQAGAVISTSEGNMVDSTSGGAWAESVITATAPANAVSASIRIRAFRTAGASDTVRADDVKWNLGNNGTAECIFVGGAVINSLPYAPVLKTYTVNSSGSSTPIISMNGKCGSGIFSIHGTFEIEVVDSIGTIFTATKDFDISRLNHTTQSGGTAPPPGGGPGDDWDYRDPQ